MPFIASGKRRSVWTPIVILAGLFLMAIGLLVYFAFKH